MKRLAVLLLLAGCASVPPPVAPCWSPSECSLYDRWPSPKPGTGIVCHLVSEAGSGRGVCTCAPIGATWAP